MGKKIKIRAFKPWIGYPGSTIQQNYGELVDKHGYFLWDIAKDNVDVELIELQNPGPFITLHYDGSLKDTVQQAKKLIDRLSRVRIKSSVHLSQKDTQVLMTGLKTHFDVIEVVFNIDASTNTSVVFSDGKSEVQRDDLRNPDVLVRLIRSYYGDSISLSSTEWDEIRSAVGGYVSEATQNDSVARNVKWTVNSLEFDNMYGYGEGNFIDFSKLSGIVGIFGPNRIGKSSIVGALSYSLFNTTDRGSIKNINVVNERKQYCVARTKLSVAGHDYLVERQTTKNESKKGVVSAPTSLNFYEIDKNGVIIRDLVGEQRTDTDKSVKLRIGSAEDFFMTSVSSQGDINQFINHGSTKRRQTLSRFLDIDIFDKMHELAKKDLNTLNGQLKQVPVVTVEDISTHDAMLFEERTRFKMAKTDIAHLNEEIENVKNEAAKYSVPVVTEAQLKQQKNKLETLEKNIDASERLILSEQNEINKNREKLKKIAEVKLEHDINKLRDMVTKLQLSESNILTVKHELEKEKSLLNQQKRSLKILTEVPCGDDYPSCKFISDAYKNKSLVDVQSSSVDALASKIELMERDFEQIKAEDYRSKLEKIEKIHDLEAKLKLDIIKKEADVAIAQKSYEKLKNDAFLSSQKLLELENILSGSENSVILGFKNKIDELQREINEVDAEKTRAGIKIGKLEHVLEQKKSDMEAREKLFKELKLYEVITNAFSKKGLPNLIVNSQLPAINDKISTILRGIVDFDIELEVDESDFLEIYINYGDSRRPIELCSGMEKMIASLALRVALVDVSTLPKSDMLVIDEGFGTLDGQGVEMCNRMLVHLKEYFRLILIITHVEGIKDTADMVLDISKKELDSQIIFNGE